MFRRAGLSAKVELDIPGTPQITVPVAAVLTKNGQKMVTKVNKEGQTENVRVVTGQTTLTKVTIVSGINAGDTVVIHSAEEIEE